MVLTTLYESAHPIYIVLYYLSIILVDNKSSFLVFVLCDMKSF